MYLAEKGSRVRVTTTSSVSDQMAGSLECAGAGEARLMYLMFVDEGIRTAPTYHTVGTHQESVRNPIATRLGDVFHAICLHISTQTHNGSEFMRLVGSHKLMRKICYLYKGCLRAVPNVRHFAILITERQ